MGKYTDASEPAVPQVANQRTSSYLAPVNPSIDGPRRRPRSLRTEFSAVPRLLIHSVLELCLPVLLPTYQRIIPTPQLFQLRNRNLDKLQIHLKGHIAAARPSAGAYRIWSHPLRNRPYLSFCSSLQPATREDTPSIGIVALAENLPLLPMNLHRMSLKH